jgi:hypothetical protein
MPTVNNPPALVAQQTGAWCFAAAEVMVRSFYNLPVMTQYNIARRSTAALAQLDPSVQDNWDMALAMDQSLNEQENGGANMASQIVQMVNSHWGAFDNAATNGHFLNTALTAADVRNEIDNNRIFVVGSPIHYYVVYGYNNNGNTMLVLDSWPPNQGGLVTQLTVVQFLTYSNRVVVLF